jgi:hypothetical protein
MRFKLYSAAVGSWNCRKFQVMFAFDAKYQDLSYAEPATSLSSLRILIQ